MKQKPSKKAELQQAQAAKAKRTQEIVFISAAVLLLAAFVGGAFLYKAQKAERSRELAQRNAAHLVKLHSPTYGKADAKVHIVEFLDPACETCREFFPFVKRLIAANPDKIKLSVRHVPFHDGSEEVVRMLEAARKQGKYWEALEALLAAQPYWTRNHRVQPELVWPHLARAGVDINRIRLDMNGPDVARNIATDMSDAKALQVTKTPEYFVNGRPMPAFGYDELRTLVEDALDEAY
jgi:protein-disulfide isomerase